MQARTRSFLIQFLILIFSVSMSLVVTRQAAAEEAFTQAELDQMLAPIALYPDSLLTQVLMASTYPLDVVEAARWTRDHPGLSGDQAVKAAEQNNWDPSVLSLLAFPQILQKMDDDLEWTERLGDAFLAQQEQVMDTVQRLRQKAWDEGYLRSNEHVKVVTRGSVIVLEPADPEVIYVPYYDPLVVYGPWWWPGYPPVYWGGWPGYYASPSVGIFWGSGISVSLGFFFGDFDWPHRRVTVINNFYHRPPHMKHHEWRRHDGPVWWRHNPEHRHGMHQGDRFHDRRQRFPSWSRFQDGVGPRQDMPVIINPHRRPEIDRRPDNHSPGNRPDLRRRDDGGRGMGLLPPRRLNTPDGRDNVTPGTPRSPAMPVIVRPVAPPPSPSLGDPDRGRENRRFDRRQHDADAPRESRSPEVPVIIRPVESRPPSPDIGNVERGGESRRFDRGQRDADSPRVPRAAEMPVIVRPEQPRPSSPGIGNAERGGENRQFNPRRQRDADSPRTPRSPEMPIIVRPEQPRPRAPDIGNDGRRGENRQFSPGRQIERQNTESLSRPRPDGSRSGMAPPRSFGNRDNPGGQRNLWEPTEGAGRSRGGADRGR